MANKPIIPVEWARINVRQRILPTSARVLGSCGMLAALCGTIGGFTGQSWLIGLANFVMLLANLYALWKG